MVAVFPKMESDSSIEDYSVRVARSWQVGQKNKDNGAVLFVFVQEHKMFLQVGYGLEGVLPDALCKRIIAEQIAPRFKAGDFDSGLAAGVQAILAATKGEYKGKGTTVAEHLQRFNEIAAVVFIVIIIALMFLVFLRGGNLGGGSSCWTIGGGGSSGGWGGGDIPVVEAFPVAGVVFPAAAAALAAAAREEAGNLCIRNTRQTSAPRPHRRGDSRGRAENLRRNSRQHQPQTH